MAGTFVGEQIGVMEMGGVEDAGPAGHDGAGLALDTTFVKIVSWYDNEWGYSNKCLEMVRVIAGK